MILYHTQSISAREKERDQLGQSWSQETSRRSNKGTVSMDKIIIPCFRRFGKKKKNPLPRQRVFLIINGLPVNINDPVKYIMTTV